MTDDWIPDYNSARWSGGDLEFEAHADGRRWTYAIAQHHLSSRTFGSAKEVLLVVMPNLRHALMIMRREDKAVKRLA